MGTFEPVRKHLLLTEKKKVTLTVCRRQAQNVGNLNMGVGL